MGNFKLGKMTFGSIFKKPETTQYPFQTKPLPEGLKGHIAIDIDECIMCGICMKRCPAGAITVEKEKGAWSNNRFRCVQCGLCVRECPKKCLSMEPTYTKPSTGKFIDTYTKVGDGGDATAKDAEAEAEKSA